MSANGGSAFPFTHAADDGGQCWGHGMTLRDYFAAAALPGVLAAALGNTKLDEGICAGAAYEIADAMLKERDK